MRSGDICVTPGRKIRKTGLDFGFLSKHMGFDWESFLYFFVLASERFAKNNCLTGNMPVECLIGMGHYVSPCMNL